MSEYARCGIRGCPAKGLTRTAAVMAGIEHVHPMTPAVPDPTVEALSEAEQGQIREAMRGYAFGPMYDAVGRILAARAAAPDALRVAVEALAAEWERTDWNATPHLGCLDMYRHCGGLLRALLDDPALAGRATGGEG